MSAPIQNRDKLEAVQQYAPPWAREQAQSPHAGAPHHVEPSRAEPPLAAPASTLSDAVERVAQSALALRAQTEAPPPAAAEGRSADAGQYESAAAYDSTPARPSARMPRGVGGPNLEWRQERDRPSPPSHMSQGDIAVKALRQRLSLDPELPPEPPIRARQRAIMPLIGRLGLVMVVAAAVAYGITLITVPDLRPTSFKPISFKHDPSVATAVDPAYTPPPVARAMPVRLVIEGRQAFANEPLPLGVSLNGATGGEFALLTGLALGTRLSVGNAFGNNGWKLAARDLTSAFAYAPRDFVGVMDAAIDVRSSSDMLIDRNAMRLEWIGKPQPQLRAPQPRPEQAAPPAAPAPAAAIPVVQPIDAEELATLLKRGQEYLRNGDIAAARLVLRRAANAGNAQAALTLGSTFDPIVFGELGVLGFTADPVQARAWYERAGQLGSPEAARRIERLTRVR